MVKSDIAQFLSFAILILIQFGTIPKIIWAGAAGGVGGRNLLGLHYIGFQINIFLYLGLYIRLRLNLLPLNPGSRLEISQGSQLSWCGTYPE